jgi:hypothetical protein
VKYGSHADASILGDPTIAHSGESSGELNGFVGLGREGQVTVLGFVDVLQDPAARREHSGQHLRVEQRVGLHLLLVATGECLAPDRMKEHQTALRSGGSSQRLQEATGVGDVGQKSGCKDGVDTIRRAGKTRHVREQQSGAHVSRVFGRGAEHLRRGVHSHDKPVVTDRALQQGKRSTRAATEIHDDVTAIEPQCRDRDCVRRLVVGKAFVPARRTWTEELSCAA